MTRILVPGVEPGQWRRASRLRAEPETAGVELRFAVGLHPCFEGDLAELEGWIDRLDAVAIGEIGWDRATPFDEATVDATADAQIELARSRALPVIIHVVGAHGHAVERLRRHTGLRGVVHAYSGSAELVDVYVRLGLHVSIGPSVLDARARKVASAAARVPAERLLVETDAPDQTAEPADVARVVARLAALRDATVEAIAEQTFANAEALFGGA
ncbi:MAG: TatD family hydrolase [Myxococcales bacterium]|nr:TatD family hydrolase [Myxococcales bacterium]